MKKIKTISKFIGAAWRQCIPSVILAVFIVGLQIMMPIAVRQFLYRIEANATVRVLIVSLMLYALLLGVYNFIDVIWMKSLDRMGGAILSGVRSELMRAIYYAPYKKVLGIGTEKIKNIIYMDTINIFSCISVHTVNVIIHFVIICIFEVIAFGIDVMFGGALLLVAVVGFLLALLTRNRVASASRGVNMKMKLDNKNVNEYIDSIETARNNNLITYFVDKEKRCIDEFIGTSIKADNTLVSLQNLVSQFHQWASLLLIALTTMYVKGDAGNLVFAMLVLDIVLDASKSLENSLYQIVRNEPSFEHVEELLSLTQELKHEKMSSVDSISFENVSFSYESRNEQEPKKIISDLSAEFNKGEIIHVKGENGKGKSTFIKLLDGLLEPDNGIIRFDNKKLSDIEPSARCANILYVGQDETLLNETIEDYLKIMGSGVNGDEAVDEKKVHEIMSKLGLDGIGRGIEELGMSLSGGQRRKLLLAKLMLFYEYAPIIIIDEIENDLDKDTRELWNEFTKKLYAEKDKHIIFYISHDKSEEYCTREFVL